MNQSVDNPNRALPEGETAEILGVTVRTLQGWRQQRRGPKYLSYSRRCVRYRLSDVLRFQEQHARAASDHDAR
jgi:hypothetical protein